VGKGNNVDVAPLKTLAHVPEFFIFPHPRTGGWALQTLAKVFIREKLTFSIIHPRIPTYWRFK
jgi:hypothetical protein